MWDQAKAAILDLTEIAPDAEEVTELIAQVSKGQQAKVPAVTVEAEPVEIEEAPVAFAPIEVEEPVIEESLPAVPVIEERPVAAEPAPALDLENVLDIVEPPKPKPAKTPIAAGRASCRTVDRRYSWRLSSGPGELRPCGFRSQTNSQRARIADSGACDGSRCGSGHR